MKSWIAIVGAGAAGVVAGMIVLVFDAPTWAQVMTAVIVSNITLVHITLVRGGDYR